MASRFDFDVLPRHSDRKSRIMSKYTSDCVSKFLGDLLCSGVVLAVAAVKQRQSNRDVLLASRGKLQNRRFGAGIVCQNPIIAIHAGQPARFFLHLLLGYEQSVDRQ